MVIESLLTALLIPDYAPEEALDGPDYPFTYRRGHPSFPTNAMSISGPYRLVVGKDRLQYTGQRRAKVIFQLPYDLLESINGGQGQLEILLGDGQDRAEIDFFPTGLTKTRDMRRLIRKVDSRVRSWRNSRAAL